MLEVEKRDASNSDFMTSASIELGMHIDETHFSLIQRAAYIYMLLISDTHHFSARLDLIPCPRFLFYEVGFGGVKHEIAGSNSLSNSQMNPLPTYFLNQL